MRYFRVVVFAVAAVLSLSAQETVKPKDVREIGKGGSGAISKLQELLKDPDPSVRVEVVKQLTDIGTARSIDPLILATRDNDPEVEMRATDGLVNFYLPGYVKTGITAPMMRVGKSIKGRFTDTNDQVIPSYVEVRPEVIAALGKLATGAGNMDARADAARALGILRGKAALPDLIEAAHSKNSTVIYESLVAMQKIRDESAAPGIAFLLNDFDSKVQIAAIETTGILRHQQSLPELVAVFGRTRDAKVKRAALTAIAMLPDESSRNLYAENLRDKDEKLRAAAAEGYARLHKAADMPMLEKAWEDEGKTAPRLALAFAQVMLGKTEISEFSPLKFLINNLGSAAYDGVAYPYLVELARNQTVLDALYAPSDTGTRSEKLYLARVLAASGNQSTVPVLRKMSADPDAEVAQAGLSALRTLQARLQ